MTPLQSFILGIVEGITEYLPVSSTGHLILTSWLLGLGKDEAHKEAVDAFEVIIQAGAIFAVVGLYRATLMQMARGVKWRLSRRGTLAAGPMRDGWVLARNVVVAFMPAVVAGVLLAKPIKQHLFHPWPVIAALAVGGLAMLFIAPWQKRVNLAHANGAPARMTLARMSMGHATFIGCMQCVAMWPGTSRSLMTIVAGLIIGLRAVDAAKFSFLLGLVTLTAAAGKDAVGVMFPKDPTAPHFLELIGGWLPLIMGLAAAWASAALAVDLFVAYLGRHTLALFGWWRLVLAAAFAAALLWNGNGPTIAP